MFRKGNPGDCQGVYELMCELEQRQLPFDKFSEIYQSQVKDERYYCLVCQENERIIGVLNLRFEAQLHHAERIAEVLEFAIDPACRNRGTGREMFDRACALSKEFGCSQIELATNQLRKDAHRFYERAGMHNFHYKFSKSLTGADMTENKIGR